MDQVTQPAIKIAIDNFNLLKLPWQIILQQKESLTNEPTKQNGIVSSHQIFAFGEKMDEPQIHLNLSIKIDIARFYRYSLRNLIIKNCT